MKKKLFVLTLALALCFGLTVSAAGTEDTTVLQYNGVEFGKVTLSGYLSEGKQPFNIEGDTVDWSYCNVAQDSTCTIESYDFGGHLELT